MAVTPALVSSPQPTATEPSLAPHVGLLTARKPPPLWRLALVGLGPLAALGAFALLFAFFQRLA